MNRQQNQYDFGNCDSLERMNNDEMDVPQELHQKFSFSNSTFHTPRDQLGSSNAIYLVEDKQSDSYEFFMPSYLQMRVRNLKETNLANRYFLLNVEIDLTIYYGELSHVMLCCLRKKLRIRVGEESLSLYCEGENWLRMSQNEDKKTIHYNIVMDAHFVFSTSSDIQKQYQSSVVFSPFEEIKCRLQVEIQTLSFIGSQMAESRSEFDQKNHQEFLMEIGMDAQVEEQKIKYFRFRFNLMNFQESCNDPKVLEKIRGFYASMVKNLDNIVQNIRSLETNQYFQILKENLGSKSKIKKEQHLQCQSKMFSFQSFELENYYSVIRDQIRYQISNENFASLCITKKFQKCLTSVSFQGQDKAKVQSHKEKMEQKIQIFRGEIRRMSQSKEKFKKKSQNWKLFEILLKNMKNVYIVATQYSQFVAYNEYQQDELKDKQQENCLWNVEFTYDKSKDYIKVKIFYKQKSSKLLYVKMVYKEKQSQNEGSEGKELDYLFQIEYPWSVKSVNSQKKVKKVTFFDESGMSLKKRKQMAVSEAKQSNSPKEIFENYQYTHYFMTLYKKPGIPLLIQYVPIFIIAFINLSLFFSPLNLNERIAQTAVFLVAYMAYIPLSRSFVVHYDRMLWAEALIYLQIFSSCLPIVDALILTEGQERVQLDEQHFLFWVSFSLTMGIALLISVRYAVFKFFTEKRWRNSSKRPLNGTQLVYHNAAPSSRMLIHSANNFESDLMFYMNKPARTLMNVIQENSLEITRKKKDA